MEFPNIPEDMLELLDELGTFPDLSTATVDDDANQIPESSPPSTNLTATEAVGPDELLGLQYHPPATTGTFVPRGMGGVHSDQESSNGSTETSLDLSNAQSTTPVILYPSPSSALVVGSACPRCGQVHPRLVRAEACLNKSSGARPFLCSGDCGEPGWCVFVPS